ncbi:hypothetical protein KAI04_04265 [Candidatus Pacearchaeota archaeon]|nr:hypothetical protein [Candidatus Pacearchaeota archaeon]
MINKIIEDLKKEIERLKENHGKKVYLCYPNISDERIFNNIKLIQECKTKLQAYEDTQRIVCKEIKKLKFTGKFKGIDEPTDRAYQKGNNDVLKELLKKFQGGGNSQVKNRNVEEIRELKT